MLILRHFRDDTRPCDLAGDHEIGRSTAYRYTDEGTDVPAGQAVGLHRLPVRQVTAVGVVPR
ncbi:hypothetical protein F4561_005886 [Lipingzhangella halophila]|uniref:Uncharacterized protein n=1 Tax=Lipingzhangella halophila TaxID=1783352 RepID=A0A7W7W578_9ACTN|nr:hypothetical protein [Lipingzhangella halophila]